MIPRTFRPQTGRGHTLIELVSVIAIMAIVVAMVAVFVRRPVEGYVDLSRRSMLVDSAESALRRMARDVRIALPNSVRVTNVATGYAMELLPNVDGARHASGEASACENLTGFDPAAADADFDILGTFPTIAPGVYASHRLVINNRGAGTTHDVYADGVTPSPAPPLVITPVTTSITIALNPVGGCPANGKHHITLSAAHQFRSQSPRDRLFILTTPVTYLCVVTVGATVGTLTRYSGYAIQAAQPTTAATLNALPGVASAVVADRISACSATTTTTNVQDRGIVTFSLALAEQGEQITLIHQVQLDNSR